MVKTGFSIVKTALFFLLLLIHVATVQALTPANIKPWQSWINERHDNIACPWLMSAGNQRACEWPGRLQMTLTATGMDFSFDIDVFSKRAHVQLPGNSKHWPVNVSVNNRPAGVIEQNSVPHIALLKGKHTVKGRFQWKTKPASLTVPLSIAFVELFENGRSIALNRRQGEIVFSQQQVKDEQNKRDSIKVEVYRLLSDGVPLTLETRLVLSVSGKPREIRIGRMLLEGTESMLLESKLPARIEADGDLRLQVVAGEHNVRSLSRYIANPTMLKMHATSSDWPQFEYLSFASNTHIRQSKLSGAVSIDTSQVMIPRPWQELPTYRLDKETTLNIETQLRGDHAPIANQFTVKRDLWLDFDGRAMTTLDRIEGKMYQQWRLDANADTAIGRATVEDAPVLITLDNQQQGIEIRSPDINLNAVTRVHSPAEFSASGWDLRADNYYAKLHLPPGWRVLHASGIDSIYGTWISQWDLWDIFLLLMIVAATRKIIGLYAGVLAAVTCVVIYHEANTPIAYFPVLLLLLVLLPVLKTRLRKIAISSAVLVSALLLINLLAFAVSAFRLAIYPTLEKTRLYHYNTTASYTRAPASLQVAQKLIGDDAVAEMEDSVESFRDALPKRSRVKNAAGRPVSAQENRPKYQIDDNDRVQTGPGLPTWSWNSVTLQSSSPVISEQNVSIVYSSPLITGLWRVSSVFLMMAYAGVLLMQLVQRIRASATSPQTGASASDNNTKPSSPVPNLVNAVLPLMLLTAALWLSPSNNAIADEFPPAFLLKELEEKMLKAPTCLPHCVSLNNGKLIANQNNIELSFTVYADADVAMPIAMAKNAWLPTVVMVDGNANTPARVLNGQVQLFLTKGEHRVSMAGAASGEQIALVLLLPIHNFSVRSDFWDVDGLVDGRVLNNTLTLRAKAKNQADKIDSLIPEPVAPMVIVHREFIFAKQWQLKTQVTRFAPHAGSFSVNIPLLDYEKVLSDSVNIKEGVALLQFAPHDQSLAWLSSIEPVATLTLIAKNDPQYFETWRVEPSSLWRIDYQGLAPVKEAGDVSSLQPFWKPWPNEKLTINISKPTGIQGPTYTVEDATLGYEAGKKLQKSTLALTIRASLGEDFVMTLPATADVLSLKLAGKPLNLPASNEVTVALQPGEQLLEVAFQEQRELALIADSPVIQLPSGATNISIEYSLPRDRWPLFISGPAIGPAMLYWGMLCVILIVAVGLSLLSRKLKLAVPVSLIGWLLLGIGFSTVNSYGVVVIALFFFVLAARQQYIDPEQLGRLRFNGLQCVLVLLTIVSVTIVIAAIPMGLLSSPDMKVVGNGSYSHLYHFYQDRAGINDFPAAHVLSVPLLSYRAAMLFWSFWLASQIVRWAGWWWQAYSAKKVWISAEKISKT